MTKYYVNAPDWEEHGQEVFPRDEHGVYLTGVGEFMTPQYSENGNGWYAGEKRCYIAVPGGLVKEN